MVKSYLLILFCFSNLIATSQITENHYLLNPTQYKQTGFDENNSNEILIPIKKGDTYVIHSEIFFLNQRKSKLMANALKAIGLGLAKYHPSNMLSAANKSLMPIVSSNANLPLGVGTILFSDEMAKVKFKSNDLVFKATFYDDNKNLISSDLIPFGYNIAKEVGFRIRGTAEVTGYFNLKAFNIPDNNKNNLGIDIFNNQDEEINNTNVFLIPDYQQRRRRINLNEEIIQTRKSPDLLNTMQLTLPDKSIELNMFQSIPIPIAIKKQSVTNEAITYETSNSGSTRNYGRYVNRKLPAFSFLSKTNNKSNNKKKSNIPSVYFIRTRNRFRLKSTKPGEWFDDEQILPPTLPGIRRGLDSDDPEGDLLNDIYGYENENTSGTLDEQYLDEAFLDNSGDFGGGGGPDDNYFVWTDPITGEEYLYYIPLDSYTELDDGTIVYHNGDGSFTVEYTSDTDVTVSATTHVTVQRSGADVFITGVGIGADAHSVAISAINLSTRLESMLASLGLGVGVVSIVAGGVPAAINLLRDLFNGNRINKSDLVSLGIAILGAFALAGGFAELGIFVKLLIDLVLAIGGTIWDVWDLLF